MACPHRPNMERTSPRPPPRIRSQPFNAIRRRGWRRQCAGRASAGAGSSNVTEGKGSNENSNEFSGTVTAVVVGVLPE